MNRITTGGKAIGHAQRIKVIEALGAVTIDAACENFEDNLKGSIEVGKLEDFVILEENPPSITQRESKIFGYSKPS